MDLVLLGTFNARQADHRNGGQTRDRTQSEDGEGCKGNNIKFSFDISKQGIRSR